MADLGVKTVAMPHAFNRTGLADHPSVFPQNSHKQIPLIDFADLKNSSGSSNSRRHGSLLQLRRACQDWGFFQVVNHGVDKGIIENMWIASQQLFELPVEVKQGFNMQSALPPSIMEKFSLNKEVLAKLATPKETLRFLDFNPFEQDAIPYAPKFFRGPALEYYQAIVQFSEALFEVLSESLGMEPSAFLHESGNNSLIRTSLHSYYPSSDPTCMIGLPGHKDMSSFTILMEDMVGGLQVLKDDEWFDVKPLEGAFVVNIGEVMENMSNGCFKSVMHRAVFNKEVTRRSIATFFLPTLKARIRPLPALTSEENPPKYKDDIFENHYLNHFARFLNQK